MPSTIAGLDILSADLTMPIIGAWHVTGDASGETELSGSVTLEVDGETFVGTFIRSGLSGGRLRYKVVGGAGKLSTILDAKNYASGVGSGVKVGTVVRDILRQAGETLSSTAQAPILDVSLAKWERSRGPASRALVSVLEAAGGSWRVLADGTVWVGVDSYPEVDIGDALLDEDWAHGVLDLAPDAPTLRPGVTVLGQQISYVVHKVRPDGLRTEAYVTGGPSNAFERIFAGLRREIDFSRSYSARVVAQNADKTLSLDPDEPRMKGRGLDQVPIRAGIPATVETTKGARVTFRFANGDPRRPYVESWETTATTKVSINGGTLPAARQGDMVRIPLTIEYLTQLAALLVSGTPGSPVAPNPSAAGLLQTGTIAEFGIIAAGNPSIQE